MSLRARLGGELKNKRIEISVKVHKRPMRVSKAIGLNPKSSASYIQLYHGNAELLMESLEVVQQTSALILAAITMEEPVPPKALEPQSAPEATPETQDAGYLPAPADTTEAAQPAA